MDGEKNQNNFQKDSSLEFKFSTTIKWILGNYFFTKDWDEDLKGGTDFLILSAKPVRVGVRLRRYPIYKGRLYGEWFNEFTIRWERPSGVKTEIHKIREGLVDYILYGFLDSEELKIMRYFIGDLNEFRIREPEPISIKPNNPFDSYLAIYSFNQFKSEFFLKKWISNVPLKIS